MIDGSLEVALGGRIRDVLVDQPSAVACWPLCEIANTRATDIVFGHNHGTYHGGIGHGLTVDVPEGALGTYFDGTGYVNVPDDGDGYIRPGESGSRMMSLSGGAMSIAFIIFTTTADGVVRPIIQKWDGATSGWVVYMGSGNLAFYMQRPDGVVFNISGGYVADGGLHVVHCMYDPTSLQEARLSIDGVLVASATGVTAEAQVTTAPLRIGGSGSNGFIGTLALVMIGRQADAGLAARLQATRVWTAINSDVRLPAAPLQARYGISNDPDQHMGDGGTLTCALNNMASATGALQGRWTPGHANCTTGWEVGVPIRWRLYTAAVGWRTKFRGTVQRITPSAGQYGEQTVSIMAETWLRQASTSPLGSPPVQVGLPSHVVFARVVDQASTPPPAISFGAGNSTFPFALDQAGRDATVLGEMARVMHSESGYAYQIGDGTLVFESALRRHLLTTFSAAFNETMVGLGVERSMALMANSARVTYTPRVADAAPTTVLFAMAARVAIEPDQESEIEVLYRDPDQRAAKIGATDIVAPVATTDYTMSANENGTGADLTSLATVRGIATEDLGGTSMRLLVRNTSTQIGWFLLSQLRGRALRTYESTTIEWRDEASIRRYGATPPATVDLPYEGESSAALALAQRIVAMRGNPYQSVNRMTLLASNSTLEDQIVAREPGEPIGVAEPMTSLDAGDRLIISEVTLTQEHGALLRAEWTLARTSPVTLYIIGMDGFAEIGETNYALAEIAGADRIHIGVRTLAEYQAKFAAHRVKRAAVEGRTFPELPQEDPLLAALDCGRWVTSCPACGGGIALHPEWSWAACFDCGRTWTAITFPDQELLEQIDAVLSLRPAGPRSHDVMRWYSWTPDQTVIDLMAENARQGWPFPEQE